MAIKKKKSGMVLTLSIIGMAAAVGVAVSAANPDAAVAKASFASS